ncbi:MAG: S-methyl-5'-thioadenosine phosphorylase [Methanomicrobiales archaeon]
MIGIIGGTGIYEIVEMGEKIDNKIIKTPFGDSPEISIFELHDREVAFMPRHAMGHTTPPHMIKYHINICAFKRMGVDRILSTNAVGSLNKKITPGEILIPHDFLDFTKTRKNTFYDHNTVHVDITNPYCPEIRDVLIKSGEVIDKGVYVCTEGPRFETAAEVKMFKNLGGTVVGMTGIPEAILARELEMCYSSICTISNFAASISPDKLTIDEVFEILEEKEKVLIKLLSDAISKIPEDRDCSCKNALEGAKVEIGVEDL